GLVHHQVGRSGIVPRSQAGGAAAAGVVGQVVGGDGLARAIVAGRVGEPEGPGGRVGAADAGAIGARAGPVGLAVGATGAGRTRVGIVWRARRRVCDLGLKLLVVTHRAPHRPAVERDRDD